MRQLGLELLRCIQHCRLMNFKCIREIQLQPDVTNLNRRVRERYAWDCRRCDTFRDAIRNRKLIWQLLRGEWIILTFSSALNIRYWGCQGINLIQPAVTHSLVKSAKQQPRAAFSTSRQFEIIFILKLFCTIAWRCIVWWCGHIESFKDDLQMVWIELDHEKLLLNLCENVNLNLTRESAITLIWAPSQVF